MLGLGLGLGLGLARVRVFLWDLFLTYHVFVVDVQAKAEHLAAIEEQKRIREEMYRRQLEEQARLDSEAKAEVCSTPGTLVPLFRSCFHCMCV